MEKVNLYNHYSPTDGDDLISKNTHLTIVSNVFMRNGTHPLMFTGRVYNTY